MENVDFDAQDNKEFYKLLFLGGFEVFAWFTLYPVCAILAFKYARQVYANPSAWKQIPNTRLVYVPLVLIPTKYLAEW